ncbi:MAG TPA: hypothetical protein VFV78_03985, partial [Vicinamibacterales bacterium]|nr:hypothetical protein [Vicinamibacterales bacterium]
MPAGNPTALSLISRFVATAKPPDDARARALAAVIDTIGVAIAGSTEPAAEIVRRTFGPVDRTKEPLDRTNEPVDRTNEPVDRTNEPV